MPIFEYKCSDCARVFEVLHLAGQKKEIKCPDCGGEDLRKLISAPFLPSSVGRPANDDLGGCLAGKPGENGCAASDGCANAGSCCSQGVH